MTEHEPNGLEKIKVSDPALTNQEGETARLRFSRFAHLFERGGTIALYHSLTHDVVYFPNQIYQEFAGKVQRKEELPEAEQEIARDLITKGFLVSPGYDEHKPLQEIRERHLGRPIFGYEYLLLTDICNLRCKYCFLEGAMSPKHHFSFMTEETVTKAIDFFANLLESNPESHRDYIPMPAIIFYGGEPLLNQNAFFVALARISELKRAGILPPNQLTVLNTNGTVVSERLIREIKEQDVRVVVSLDGPKEVHDSNRIFANHRGSFQRVFKNLQRLHKSDIDVSISCTITPENINNVDDIIEWMASEFPLNNLGLNLLIDQPNISQSNEEYAEKATRGIIKCFELGRQKNRVEDKSMKKASAFVNKALIVKDCSGYGQQIVITPQGKVGVCQAYTGSEKFFTGDLNDPNFNPFIDTSFIEWSHRSPFNIQKCYFCTAIGLCGGGCAYNADLKHGSIWDIDENYCIHSKNMLKFFIWDLYSKTSSKEVEGL